MRHLDDLDRPARTRAVSLSDLGGRDMEHGVPNHSYIAAPLRSSRLDHEMRKTIELSRLSSYAVSRILKDEERTQHRLEEHPSADEFSEFDAYFARDDAPGAFKWVRRPLLEHDLLVKEERADDLRRQVFADITDGPVAAPGQRGSRPCSR